VLKTAFHGGVDLEALYLLGPFGVRVDGARRILTSLPTRLEAGDVTTQGLPSIRGASVNRLDPPPKRSQANVSGSD
jgi:hypothetical protein